MAPSGCIVEAVVVVVVVGLLLWLLCGVRGGVGLVAKPCVWSYDAGHPRGVSARKPSDTMCRKRANDGVMLPSGLCASTPHLTTRPPTQTHHQSDQPGVIITMSSGGKAPGGKSGGGGGGGKKGKLKDDLVRIVYGYGDAKEPVQVCACLVFRASGWLIWLVDQSVDQSVDQFDSSARASSSHPTATPPIHSPSHSPIPQQQTPTQESVELLERMVHEYVGEMCRQVSKGVRV